MNGKAFSIPWIIHEYTEQGTNGDFLLVSKQRLKTTPTFALEKQTRLERKQTRFILMLPVAGAVQYRAATSSKKLACTRMQATAACTPNYTHMRVHSVKCNVNLASTCEGLQLTLASARV